MSERRKKRADIEMAEGKFFAFLGKASLGDWSNRDYVYMGRAYGANHLFLGWSKVEFGEAVEAVRRIRTETSGKTIERVLTQSLVALFEEQFVRDDADPVADARNLESVGSHLDSGKVRSEFAEVIQRVEAEIHDWSAFVLVEGVELDGLKELKLGSAYLYNLSSGPLVEILQDETMRPGLLDKAAQFIEDKASHCRCYLMMGLEGEKQYVSEEALKRAENILTILDLYAASVRAGDSLYQRIGVLGQPSVVHRGAVIQRTPTVGAPSARPGYSFQMMCTPNRRYKISQEEVRQWRALGLDRAVESVEASDTAARSVDPRIARAIKWHARAVNANSIDEQFVDLTVALECLLVGEDSRYVGKAQRLADQASALIGGNFEGREIISKVVKNLYDVRGLIVHQGVSASKGDLLTLERVVFDTIVAFVRREIDGA